MLGKKLLVCGSFLRVPSDTCEPVYYEALEMYVMELLMKG